MTEQLQRQIANALWRPLVKREWKGPRSTRKLSDHGQGQTFHPVCTATIPKSPSMNDTIVQADGMNAAISTQTETHHVVLMKHHYWRIVHEIPMSAFDDFGEATRPSNQVPKPYTSDAREKVWDPFLTPHVYATLDLLVAAATVWPLNHDTPPELIRDTEVPEPREVVA